MNRLQEIEQRLAAIRTECMNEDADLDALTTEANSLVEERRALLNQQNDSAERRRALLAAIANGTAGAGNVAPGTAQVELLELVSIQNESQRQPRDGPRVCAVRWLPCYLAQGRAHPHR